MTVKKALVIRIGAYGDMIMASPVYRLLKEDGYHVTAYVNSRGAEILKHNPHINKVVLHDEKIPIEKLPDHWKEIGKGYDKVVNLTGSIEEGLLAPEWAAEWKLPKEERHALMNVNYYDRTVALAGYPDKKGQTGELYFSGYELMEARQFRRKHSGKYLVMWSLSGSAQHKNYPWAEYVANAFLNLHPDAVILTVGDDSCRLIEFDHPRAKGYSGVWHIRKSMAIASFCDLIIAPETAMLNAGGAFEKPAKIALLSHSSEENLTKYFDNCLSLHADVACYPCHKLHYDISTCELDDKLSHPVCMTNLKADDLLRAMEAFYQEKRTGKPHVFYPNWTMFKKGEPLNLDHVLTAGAFF